MTIAQNKINKSANFRFKQFEIQQDLCAMKVGTDGVLLGAWTKVEENDYILDVGCGTGLISLILAQKDNSIRIKAIDIDDGAVQQSKINVSNSCFHRQIEVYFIDFGLMHGKENFSVIVSNPPYFINSMKASGEQRTRARHSDTLSVKTLLHKSFELLKKGGRLSLIYPIDIKPQLIEISKDIGFEIKRITNVYPTNNSENPKRFMIELIKLGNVQNKERIEDGSNLSEDSLVIETQRHKYSEEYKELTKDYYLKFM